MINPRQNADFGADFKCERITIFVALLFYIEQVLVTKVLKKQDFLLEEVLHSENYCAGNKNDYLKLQASFFDKAPWVTF